MFIIFLAKIILYVKNNSHAIKEYVLLKTRNYRFSGKFSLNTVYSCFLPNNTRIDCKSLHTRKINSIKVRIIVLEKEAFDIRRGDAIGCDACQDSRRLFIHSCSVQHVRTREHIYYQEYRGFYFNYRRHGGPRQRRFEIYRYGYFEFLEISTETSYHRYI